MEDRETFADAVRNNPVNHTLVFGVLSTVVFGIGYVIVTELW